MPESLDEKRASSCLKKMINWLYSDTFIFLDKVLEDSIDDPEFSALTCWMNFETLLEAKEVFFGDPPLDVVDYLRMNNYTEQQINSFIYRKQLEEEEFKGKSTD